MITALAGGTGAARFLTGLSQVIGEDDLSIVVNTGDDIELFGLHISPDRDIIMYTLAGIVDEEKGWGVRNDTFNCIEELTKMEEVWFQLGDKDLATHIFRTNLLKNGLTLSQVTKNIGCLLGLRENIIPMTNDKFETRVITDVGSIHFEEYLVKRGSRDRVLGVEYAGSESAKPAAGVLESILDSELVIICPSNPVVSIGTILSVKGVRAALKRTEARKVAISPIVSGKPIKGPADKLMKGLGLEVSAFSVAKLYSDFLDTFILDEVDAKDKDQIENLGIEAVATNTIMKSLKDKIELANTVLRT